MSLKDVELKETPQRIQKHIRKIRNNTHDRFETQHLCKSGQPVDLEIRANYMPQDDGENFFVFAHNITRRKRNEEAIKQNEARYRELADSITDSFVALDSDLKYTYWNKACQKITKITAKDAIGKSFFDIFGKDTNTKKIANIYLKALKTRKPQVFIDTLTMGGHRAVVENHVYPTRTGVSVFTKDITQRKDLQDKLEEYAQHLEDLVKIRTEKLKNAERLATIGEMAGMVGHDIRNPLQSISGELYLAKNELDSLSECEAKETLLESMGIIGEQLAYINKIVSDLQDYAKPLVPCPEEVDLKKTITEILSSVTIPQDIRVNVSIENSFPKLETDSSYLRRILINLITNAVQAMSKGGKLSITANNDELHAFIRVQDTGEGIPEEAKIKIFKPLFTTKSKGQGFGLAVVKKLTDSLGGNVTFESTVGKGTQFTVEIPLRMSAL
jgi:PAS domain S-box-containing protein